MKKILFVLVCVLMSLSMYSQDLTVGSLFADNMVLQQNTEAKIWGTTIPNTSVEVKTSWGITKSVVSDKDGKWITSLLTRKSGGIFQITIQSGKQTLSINNVVFGEVWVCSGQSNMEMPLAGWPPLDTIQNSAKEIANSKNPNIRMFTVQRDFSLIENIVCKGKWEEASPQTTPHFSAVAYFYAQKLYKELGVPIGLIHTSWGGTPGEAWVRSSELSGITEFADVVKQNQSLLASQQEYMNWIVKHKQITLNEKATELDKWKNLEFNDISCSKIETDDSQWPTMTLPCTSWEAKEIGNFDGVVWYRKSVEFPAAMLKGDCIINIPGVDDMDRVYVNGVLVGSTEVSGFWQSQRKYKVPATVLREGKNIITIRVLDNQGGGGIGSTHSAFDISSLIDSTKKVDLSGEWKYNVAALLKNSVFYVFDVKNVEWLKRPKSVNVGESTPSVLFNAMIRPVIPYTIKGVIWNQGETNVGRAQQYQQLLPLLVRSWRDAWGQNLFPFYVVQIAPWGYSGATNTECAELRDAQRLACNKIDKSGLVVTLDLGEDRTIHPPRKQPVGERLALWALAKDYAKPIVCSGPIFKSSRVVGNTIEIEFLEATGLYLTDVLNNGFQIAGTDKKFVDAKVEIVGDKVVVRSESIQTPAYVRYAYLNTSKAKLYNKAGLPASTFRTE